MRVAVFAVTAAIAASAAAAPVQEKDRPREVPRPPALAELPDEQFCGIEPDGGGRPAPLPGCKLPGVPCGPVPASRIGRSGAEPGEDLDGDGHGDITLAGRREGPRPESFGVIYLWRPEGFVLADYHGVDPRADPQVASVALSLPGQAPIVRDGYDLPLSEGTTHSVARLRRFDGQRFRTLLVFCAHRQAVLEGGAARVGHNRADFVDVDQDGTPEVVIAGLLRPQVFRLDAGGLRLVPDPALTERHRQNSPEEQKARAMMKEAARLFADGHWRRSAAVLQRAHGIAPYNVEVLLQLAAAHLKIDQAVEAVEVLKKARALAADRTQVPCLLAQALRKLDDEEAELSAINECLDRGPPPEMRAALAERKKELTAAPPPEAPPAPPR